MTEASSEERVRWTYHVAQLSKYGSVGVVNTLIDFAILNLLSFTSGIYRGPWLILFNTISFAAAVTNSYILNKRWTFKHAPPGNAKEFSKFVAVYLIGLALNSIIVYALTSVAYPPIEIHPHLWLNIAKVLSTGVSGLWNFGAMKFLVFRDRV